MMFEEKKLYWQAGVCALLGKSEAWAERSRWNGTDPGFVKIGRQFAYRGFDVLTWIDSRTCASTADRGRHERRKSHYHRNSQDYLVLPV